MSPPRVVSSVYISACEASRQIFGNSQRHLLRARYAVSGVAHICSMVPRTYSEQAMAKLGHTSKLWHCIRVVFTPKRSPHPRDHTHNLVGRFVEEGTPSGTALDWVSQSIMSGFQFWPAW